MMPTMRTLRGVALLTALPLAACGEDTANAANTVPDRQPPAANGAPQGLNVAFGAPRLIAAIAYASRAMIVEAVYHATAVSGSGLLGTVTTTGTVQVSNLGTQYLPTPTDKLVVDLGGQQHEFVVTNVQGNLQAADAATWLASPHVLSYRHVVPGQAEAEIDVRYDGAAFEVHVRGNATFGGERTAVDLTANGRTAATRDYHGQDVTTQYSVAGTLRGEGFEVDVREEHSSRLVAATSLRLLHSMRGSASIVSSRISSVVRSGGAEYRFDGVQVQSTYAEKGGNTTNQESTASGTVSKDGEPFGDCDVAGGAPVLRTRTDVLGLGL